MPSASFGLVEEEVNSGPVDIAIEHHPDRTVFRLPAARDDMHLAVIEAQAGAGQSQLGRIKLQVREMDDEVVSAFEVHRE